MKERQEYLALLAEDYRTLTMVGSQMDRNTYTALQWGTAIVAIVTGATISQWGKSDAIVELVFLAAIPTLLAVGMLYWVGELARMRRLYDFVCIIEAKAELALQHAEPDANRKDWVDSFNREWIDSRDSLLERLSLAKPKTKKGEVIEVESGPIAWERWLRDIRNKEASGNLSWVFIVRFVLFPSAIAASWITGVYYVWFQSAHQGFLWKSLVVALYGLLLGVVTVWLGYEIADDLNHSASTELLEVSGIRQAFRHALSDLLRIPEWHKLQDGSKLPD